jgi:predicted component of type VI protein secretion system
VIVDLGGGWGGDALQHLTKNEIDAIGYMGVKTSSHRTRDNMLRFFNVRTEAYWRLREALDPEQQGGSLIQLPNDKELLADLTAPVYTTKGEKGGMVLTLEPKDKLVKRLGRSPDKGDAVVMCWFSGEKAINDLQVRERRGVGGRVGRTPKVVMGREAARRRQAARHRRQEEAEDAGACPGPAGHAFVRRGADPPGSQARDHPGPRSSREGQHDPDRREAGRVLMAKKIIRAVGKGLGIGGKKKKPAEAEATIPTVAKSYSPVIKQLGTARPGSASARPGLGSSTYNPATILSDKLGG